MRPCLKNKHKEMAEASHQQGRIFLPPYQIQFLLVWSPPLSGTPGGEKLIPGSNFLNLLIRSQSCSLVRSQAWVSYANRVSPERLNAYIKSTHSCQGKKVHNQCEKKNNKYDLLKMHFQSLPLSSQKCCATAFSICLRPLL